MLAGDGHAIFRVNLPFLHYGSMTLKTIGNRAEVEGAITRGSRAYYARKWGGPVNQETYRQPFDSTFVVEDGSATTPYLQAHPPESSDADLD